jgi:division/cell wall cluster transcriptional repressor MraZ
MASRKTLFAWMALGCVAGLASVLAMARWIESAKAGSQSNYLSASIAHLPRAAERAVATALAKRPAANAPAPTEQVAAASAADPAPLPVPEPTAPTAASPPLATLEPPASVPQKPAEAADKKPVDAPPPGGVELPPLPPVAAAASPASPPSGTAAAPSWSSPAVPEPAPAAPVSPPAAKADPLPPPLPTAISVPAPADDLKPVPQPPPGEPLPPLTEKAPSPASIVPAEAKLEVKSAGLTPPPAAPAPLARPAVEQAPELPLPRVEVINTFPTAKGSAEPPLAPSPGPVVPYQVRNGGETMREIARRTLGGENRWTDIHRLNPALPPEEIIQTSATVKLPADACIRDDDSIQPLPSMRPKAAPQKSKPVLPLTGTFSANLDDKRILLLPKAIRDQLGSCDTLLISPGSDQCLWVTNQTHLDRLADRLERSPAHEMDVRTFRRLYYAQTEKASMADDGRLTVPERLAQFAGLHQEVLLIGIDDHFEIWDAANWRRYTQQKSAAARAAMAERE